MKKYYVYKLQIEGEDFPFYIGKGSGTRMLHHFMPYELKKKTHKSFKILKAIRNGIKILTIIIEDNLSEHEAFELESSLVRQYGRLDNNTGILVNKCDGGKGSPKVKVSNNTRAKLSEVSKRRIVTTKTRERLSAANIGKIVVFDVETGKHIRIAVQDYKDNRARYSTVLDRRNALGIKPTLGMKHNGWKLSDVTKNKHCLILVN